MKKLFIGMAILIGIPMLVIAGWFGYSYWQWQTAPEFLLQQKLSPDGQFMESYLISGDIRYVLKGIEFSLVPEDSFSIRRLVGRQESMRICSVPGNDDYVTYSGFMFSPQVFRKDSAPPIDFATLPIREIRFFGDQGGGTVRKTVRDFELIQEVARSLAKPTNPLPGKTDRIDQIRLFSDHLPGLYIYVYIMRYPDQTVYFSFPAEQERGIPAGPLFTRWSSPK
jgi:hypothetical protein